MFDKTEYQRNYRKEKLKRVSLELPKEKYEEVKEHSLGRSESVNGFIKRAINETIERDNSK